MAKRKPVEMEKYGLADALSSAFGIVEELGEEMQSWYDNMPESLQNGDKASTIQESADTLQNVSTVELPDELDDSVKPETERAVIRIMPLKPRASRADRLGYAVDLLQQVKDELQQNIVDPYEDGETESVEFTEEQTKIKEEAEQVITDLDEAISELENVEFPGMFG